MDINGWYHVTNESNAHRFENGHPLCQMSDIGDVIDAGNDSRVINKICSDCRVVFRSRILMAIRKARKRDNT